MPEDKNEFIQNVWLQYELYIRKLCSYKLSSLPDYIDDCVQDVFLDFSNALNGGKAIEHPKAWLTKVAGNKIKDIYSQVRKENERFVSLETRAEKDAYRIEIFDEAFPVSDEKLLSYKEIILGMLTSKEQQLLNDRYALKKSIPQIAKEHKTTENNIYQRIFRLKVKTKMLVEKVLNE